MIATFRSIVLSLVVLCPAQGADSSSRTASTSTSSIESAQSSNDDLRAYFRRDGWRHGQLSLSSSTADTSTRLGHSGSESSSAFSGPDAKQDPLPQDLRNNTLSMSTDSLSDRE